MSSVMGSTSNSFSVLTDPPIVLPDGRPQRAGQSFSTTCVVKVPSISSPSVVLTLMGMTTWWSTVLLCASANRNVRGFHMTLIASSGMPRTFFRCS
eukprot:12013159-Heterocapsa_arctica.AAC.1